MNDTEDMAAQWAQVNHHCIPTATPTEIKEDLALCFYMGGAAVFNLLRGEPSVARFSEVQEEIRSFLEKNKGRSYVGGQQ